MQASELIRSLLKSDRPSSLAQAIIEASRINKTLYLLNYVDDEDYRRRILAQLNRGESRHAVARAIQCRPNRVPGSDLPNDVTAPRFSAHLALPERGGLGPGLLGLAGGAHTAPVIDKGSIAEQRRRNPDRIEPGHAPGGIDAF